MPAAGLRVSGLDFVAGTVSVSRRDRRGNVGDTKSPRSIRVLPLGDTVGALLEHVASKGPGDRVFTRRGALIVDNTPLANCLTPRMTDMFEG